MSRSISRPEAMQLQDMAAIKGHPYIPLLAAAGTVSSAAWGDSLGALGQRLSSRLGCTLLCTGNAVLNWLWWGDLTQILLPLCSSHKETDH